MFDRWDRTMPIGRLLFIPIAIICVIIWLWGLATIVILGSLFVFLLTPIQWVVERKTTIGDKWAHVIVHWGNFVFGKKAYSYFIEHL